MLLRNFHNLRHLRIRHILRRPISLRSRRGANGTIPNGHDSPLFHIPEQLRLLTVPFQHLYRLLEDENVDVILSFADTRRSHGTYRELAKVPIICVCSPDSPLAQRSSVNVSDFQDQRLILIDPEKSPGQVSSFQAMFTAGHPMSDFYFCESFEAAGILVKAGFGVSVLPQLFIPPNSSMVQIPLENTKPMSLGLYYKNLRQWQDIKFIDKKENKK